jgi:hypothetical protein
MLAVVGCVLLLSGLFVWSAVHAVRFFSAPSVLDEMPVSTRDTTAGLPLAPDGSVDYLAAYNAEFGEGATPENNAAVLVLKAFGAEIWSEHGEDEAAELMAGTRDALGLTADEPLPDTWLSPYEFVDSGRATEVAGGEVVDDYVIEELDNKCRERPWRGEEYPVFAFWLEENAHALDLLVEASKRERWFWPAVGGSSPSGLAEVTLPELSPLRQAGRALAARAMLAIAEGEPAAACQDALALRRLGRLVRSQDGCMIACLVGAALEDLVVDTEMAIALSGSVPVDLKKQLAVQIWALPGVTGRERVLDKSERWFAHGELLGHFRKMGISPTPQDFALARGVVDAWYDRAVEAAGLSPWAERHAALRAIEDEMDAIGDELGSATGAFTATLQGGNARQKPLKMLGLLSWVACAPPGDLYYAIQLSATQRADITALALLLAVHKAENGNYPGALSDLVPELLDEVPQDRFTEGDLIYRRTADGYVLYSLGPNMTDDGGPTEGLISDLRVEPGESDDIGIAVPLPMGPVAPTATKQAVTGGRADD